MNVRLSKVSVVGAGLVSALASARVWAQAQPSQQEMQAQEIQLMADAMADGMGAMVLAVQGAVLLLMILAPVVILLIARRNMQGWRQPVKYVWFSYNGRINRKAYWLKGVVLLSLVVFGAQLASLLLTLLIVVPLALNETAANGLSLLIMLPLIVFQLWASTAVAVKRAHDLGHSGWWVLGMLIPIWNLWVAIQLAFFRGAPNDNAYGEDPLDSYGAYIDELRGGPGGSDGGGGEAEHEAAPAAHAQPQAQQPAADAPKGFGGRKFAPKATPAAPAPARQVEAAPAQTFTPSADMDTIKRRLGDDILRPIDPKPRR